MDSVYIVMPAYNEEENIEATVRSWYPLLEGKSPASRLVVADSGSVDNTHMILERLQNEMPKLVIYEDCDRQHGPKVIALYKYAIKNQADYIFQTDSDGQTNPEEFESFWKMRKQYDAVLGYRKIREDGKSRAFVEQMVCRLLRFIFGVKVPDANAPFRLMKGNLVAKYIDRLPQDYNIPNIMFTTYFAYYKENITFRIVTFRPRQGGVNSINIRKIMKIGWKAIGDFRTFRREM
jgi:glycosyltransferase involved in cell wall biosynthesis